jgi:hypothetical protein
LLQLAKNHLREILHEEEGLLKAVANGEKEEFSKQLRNHCGHESGDSDDHLQNDDSVSVDYDNVNGFGTIFFF